MFVGDAPVAANIRLSSKVDDVGTPRTSTFDVVGPANEQTTDHGSEPPILGKTQNISILRIHSFFSVDDIKVKLSSFDEFISFIVVFASKFISYI